MIPGKHEQLGIANKTRRQPITVTLGKLYVVALFISHTHQGHVFLLQALHSVRFTIVSHQNLLNVGLAVEYLSAKLDIRDNAKNNKKNLHDCNEYMNNDELRNTLKFSQLSRYANKQATTKLPRYTQSVAWLHSVHLLCTRQSVNGANRDHYTNK